MSSRVGRDLDLGKLGKDTNHPLIAIERVIYAQNSVNEAINMDGSW
jgi:hypothetical protein